MLYQIHRYPADLIDVVRLRSGRRVLIRPVLPQDELITSAFFGNLPAQARYQRFMAPMPSLPPDLIKRFTHIDYASHLALVAEIFSDGQETVVAEARYARRDDPSVAEFAVAVAEDWQGQGLASLLLTKLLCRAGRAGIRRVVGETLATNDRMLHLARKAGFTATPSPDVRSLVLLERSIGPDLRWVGCEKVSGGADLPG
jgi:RimJ/RimL family protein N-acetyltransferase